MTIANENSLVTHTGNGVTTEWPYTFIIPDEDFARVGLFEIASSTLTLIDAADYSISGIDDPAGGEVIYPLVGDPIESTHRLVIWRELPYHQDTQLTNQTPYYSVVLEAQLDRIVMQIQQLAEESNRAFKVTQGSTATPDELIADLLEAETNASASAAAAAADAGSASSDADAAAASAAAAQATVDGAIATASIGDLADVDTTTDAPETGDGLVFDGTDWVPGPAGGGMFKGNNGTVGSRSGDIFRVNTATVSADVTIVDGERASATGPLTVADTFTITVEDGGVLTII